ncbi:MAG: hypothetical protein AAF211_27725 [Myxococcota bacterium]
MIGWMAAVVVAWAEPVALRGPRAEPTAVIGLHDFSVGAPIGPVELAASVRTDRGAFDIAVGRRWQLRGDDEGWRVDAGVSAGLVVPLVRPGVGLTATPWLSAGLLREHGFFQALVAAPIAVAAPGGARLPGLLEVAGGGTVGRVTFGPRFAFGAVVAPDTDVSVVTEGALVVSLRTP